MGELANNSNYQRHETIYREIDRISKDQAVEIASKPADLLDSELRQYKAEAYQKLGVIADHRASYKVEKGLQRLDQNPHLEITPEHYSSILEKMESVPPRGREIDTIAATTTYIETENSYKDRSKRSSMAQVAAAFNQTRRGVEEAYQDILHQIQNKDNHQ